VSTSPTPEGQARRSPWTARRIILAVVVLYAVAVVVANRHSVDVNFVVFKTSASLFVVLLLAIAFGFVVGWLFDDVRDRRRRRLRGE
jgi:uncharacterized integral membrane protein